MFAANLMHPSIVNRLMRAKRHYSLRPFQLVKIAAAQLGAA
jgi:hypothetical protein